MGIGRTFVLEGVGLWCLTPLSTIIQLYRGLGMPGEVDHIWLGGGGYSLFHAFK